MAVLRPPNYQLPINPPSVGVPPPTTASTPVTQGGYWKMPDYASLIAGDPTLIGTQASIRAGGDTAASQRRMAIRRALIQAGFSPQGWQSGFGDIDEATTRLASENPQSTLRRLGTARGQGRADLAAALAGRGMLSSGALTGGEQRIQQGFEGAQYDATQQLLDALGGYERSYSDYTREAALQEMAAREQAASRVMGTYEPEWIEPPAGTTPEAGMPTYQDLWPEYERLVKLPGGQVAY